jgi:hypothetical protein
MRAKIELGKALSANRGVKRRSAKHARPPALSHMKSVRPILQIGWDRWRRSTEEAFHHHATSAARRRITIR